jgi:hypothetical protein
MLIAFILYKLSLLISVRCTYFWDRKVYRTEDPHVKLYSSVVQKGKIQSNILFIVTCMLFLFMFIILFYCIENLVTVQFYILHAIFFSQFFTP